MLVKYKILTRDKSGVVGIIMAVTFCRGGAGVSGITMSSVGQYMR